MCGGVRRLFGFSVVIFTALMLLLLGCWFPHETPPAPPDSGMEVQLSLSDSPILGKSVQVRFILAVRRDYKYDAPNTKAQIELPNAFELVSGNLVWEGDLIRGTPVEIKATVKATKVGECKIEAGAFRSLYEGAWAGEGDTLHLAVFEDRAFVSHKPIEFGGESLPLPMFVLPPADEMVMVIELSLSNAPALGQTAKLTCTATAIRDAPGAQVYINLPEGFELVSGDWWWDGDLTKDARIELKATVRAIKTGRWHINAMGTYSPSEQSQKAVYADYLRVYVFKDGGEVIHLILAKAVRMDADLSISGAPALNQTANLTCTITALSEDVANTRARITLPNGFELVSGDLKWEGYLAKDVPLQLTATIKSVRTGIWEIRADADFYMMERDGWGISTGHDSLYIRVSEDTAAVVPPPPTPTPITPLPS